MPPFAHDDDPFRAIAAGRKLVLDAQAMGRDCSVGIATGRVVHALVTSGRTYCGLIGSADRREYTVIGDIVNLAARLMGIAAPGEVRPCSCVLSHLGFTKGSFTIQVLVDEATSEKATNEFIFEVSSTLTP